MISSIRPSIILGIERSGQDYSVVLALSIPTIVRTAKSLLAHECSPLHIESKARIHTHRWQHLGNCVWVKPIEEVLGGTMELRIKGRGMGCGVAGEDVDVQEAGTVLGSFVLVSVSTVA